MQPTKVLCLDLDGTVRKSKSGKTFIEGPDDIELIEGVEHAIMQYKSNGWVVVGISNQAGVAHGFKTTELIEAEMAATRRLFQNDPFFAIQWCPSDGAGKMWPYNYRSLNRKPDIGMLAKSEVELWGFGVIPDWDNSLFVGDRPEDEECAKNAGVPFSYIDEWLYAIGKK